MRFDAPPVWIADFRHSSKKREDVKKVPKKREDAELAPSKKPRTKLEGEDPLVVAEEDLQVVDDTLVVIEDSQVLEDPSWCRQRSWPLFDEDAFRTLDDASVNLVVEDPLMVALTRSRPPWTRWRWVEAEDPNEDSLGVLD